MKNLTNRRVLYIVLSIVILIASILPVIISKDAAITKYSIISIAFAFCSVIYAVIAFYFKNKGNMFLKGRFWFYDLLDYTFNDEDKANTKSENYKKEFELSAFIICATIPPYISFAFFANGFYSELSKAFWWTIFRELAIIAVIVAPVIKSIKARKQQTLQDEADRKEQERRESMGKWK